VTKVPVQLSAGGNDIELECGSYQGRRVRPGRNDGVQRGSSGAGGTEPFADEFNHGFDDRDVGLAVEPVAARTMTDRTDAVALIPAAQRRDRHAHAVRDDPNGVPRQFGVVVCGLQPRQNMSGRSAPDATMRFP